MGLSKFRGRGVNVGNGYFRPAGLGQSMKHTLQMGPFGMRPRFPLPPPGMPARMQTLPPPAMRPPPPFMRPPPPLGFLPPPMHSAHAGMPRRPPFPISLPPPPLHPSPYMPPVPPEVRGSRFQAIFGPAPPRGSKRGAASQRGGRGRLKAKKGNVSVSNEVEADLDKPWVSEAIKNEIHKKQELFQIAQKSSSEADWQKYREQKEKVGVIVNEAKLEFIGSHPEEAGAHYCETCDKDLKNAQKLTQHLVEHTVCGHDGCTFQAHPKVVAIHVRMQHMTGLYRKICVVDNPEDIAKWIQERKNRYPTKANIERREAEMRELVARGERLRHEPWTLLPYARGGSAQRAGRGMRNRMRGHCRMFTPKVHNDGKNMEACNAQVAEGEKQMRRGRLSSFLRSRGMRNRMRGHYRRFWPRDDGDSDCNGKEMEGWNAQVAEEEKLTRRGHLISFPGTGAFPDDSCENPSPVSQEEGFSDAEWEGSPVLSPCTKPLVASKALMSLISSYGSDESENEGDRERAKSLSVPIVPSTTDNCCNDTVSESQHREVVPAQNDSDGAPEEAPILFGEHTEEIPVLLSATVGNVEESGHLHRRRKRRERAARWKGVEGVAKVVGDERPRKLADTRSRYPRQHRPTLLDKLLREEIRHERNVILQCVNHVVKYDFYDDRSVPKVMASTVQSPIDKRLKILVDCVSHILQCGMLNRDDLGNTGSGLLECT